MSGPISTIRVLLTLASLLLVPGALHATAPVPGLPEASPTTVRAAHKAMEYGILGYGESGAFEGLRPLSTAEMDRVIKVLGLYMGRILDEMGVYRTDPAQARDLVMGLWSLARFLRGQRLAFQDLMASTESTFERALAEEPLWAFRVVEELERHLKFRTDSLRFRQALENGGDPVLDPVARQLGALLQVLDDRSRDMESQLKELLDRF